MSAQPSLATLFDLSFSKFLVVRIVRWMYCAALVVAALTFVGMVVGGIAAALAAQRDINALEAYPESSLLAAAASRRAAGFCLALASPFVTALMVIGARVLAEMTVVLFSIAESLRQR